MKKRRLRLNILDIVIVIALLSVIALIIFRGEVDELFGEPKINDIELQLTAQNVNSDIARRFKSGDEALVIFGDDESDSIAARITGVRFNSPTDDELVKLELTLELSGYRRIGVFYTEKGYKLAYDSEAVIVWDEGAQSFKISSAEFVDTTITQ